MVPAEHQAVLAQTVPLRQVFDLRAELRRLQAGVPAVLVHLVAGGLDQDRRARGHAVAYHLVEDERMRRAHRGQPDCAAGVLLGHQLVEHVLPAHHGSSASASPA